MSYMTITYNKNGSIKNVGFTRTYKRHKKSIIQLSVIDMKKFKKNFHRQKTYNLTNYCRRYNIDSRHASTYI